MSREQSDEEDCVVETEDGQVDDGTAETEVNFRLPRGSDPGPELIPKDIPIVPGAVGAEADTPDLGQQRRLGPPGGAKPKGCRYELPTQQTPGPGRSLPSTGTQPVTNRFAYELPTLPTSGHGRLLPRTRTQPEHDRFMDDLPKTDLYDFHMSPEADLMDTMTQLQLEVDALKFVQSGPSMLATETPPVQSKPASFTATKVPKFSGVTSWDQYRQVFDAIVRSNGWDDATGALQLLSHLEVDALNVALLVPEAQRATRAGLVRALTEHYGSPARLADYRRQFKRTGRHEGEDPSIFAIALETLAVKAFGDMGPNA